MAEVCVKVAVRIRPLLPKEMLHGHRVCVRVVPGSSQVMLGSDHNKTFSFHNAFGPECGQDAVYAESVRPLLDALLQGYNATVFCYGQTGSGKTYTLEGGSLAEEGGLIDRVAHDLFCLLDERSEVSEYTVNLSYLELYLEELNDLLDLPTVHKALHIREDDKGNTVVVGATETQVTSAEELLSVLATGNALRHTRPTAMNDQSSRSHAILTLHLHQRIHNPETSVRSVRRSKLRLVDLAGSERADKTGNTGPRLKESVHINTGLLALGNVIRALTNPKQLCNAKHIPYRDAKLTRLLRDSLGGQAHTLMVACVSPSDRSVTETLSVLQFASRARHIRNCPVLSTNADKQEAATLWDPMEAKVGELELQIQTMRELLKQKQSELQKERDKNKAGDGEHGYNQVIHEVANKMPRYFDLATEAGALLAEVAPAIADSFFKRRLEKWQEKFRTKSRMCHTREEDEHEEQTHSRDVLKPEQVKEALEIAEEMLQDNEAEVRQLLQKMERIEQECKAHLKELEEQREQNQIKTEQLVNQQIVIDRLRGVKSTVLGTRESSASVSSERRAQSVPLPRQSSAPRPLRKIHSSPPLFSLERIMAAFKMKGLLLLDMLDRKQEVYCPFVEQNNHESSPYEEDDDEEEFHSKMGFRRSLNRTWTSRHKKVTLLKQELDEATNECQDQQTKPRPLYKVRSSLKRRIHELSSIIRMKEELIQEMDKTDKLSQAVDRQGCRSLDSREARGVFAKISLQNQHVRAQTFHSLQHMRQQRAALQACSVQEGQETEPCQVQASANKRNKEESPEEQSAVGAWLEELEEQVLQRRAEQKELEEEQKRRAEVQERREACLQQRNRLQDKRLRSSQVLSQDLLRLSVQLENLEEQIENSNVGRVEGVSVEELTKERDGLQQRRDALEQRLQDNQVLTQEEEHCLLELEEALETLDTALEFKTQCIQRKQSSSHSWSHREDTQLRTVRRRLRELSPPEITELLITYFNKVVSLREAERALLWRCEVLELQTSEQDAVLRAMEGNMQQLALDTDRRLMQQHRENQSHVQLLLRQLRDIASNGEQWEMQDRLQHLEKELFFYKSSSRNLKKQLRELSASMPSVDRVSNLQTDKGTRTNGSEAPSTTHVPTTHARINSTLTTHSQTDSFLLHNSSTSASYHLQENKNNSSLDSHTSLTKSGDSAQSCRSEEKRTPVRVHRRDLRQISLSRLRASRLSNRGQQSSVETSTDTTTLEDSIEVSRKTEG